MRGRDGQNYCILSSPHLAFNMMISETDFLLPRQEVHGSFFTQASFVMRPTSGDALPDLKVLVHANKEGFEVHTDNEPPSLFGKHVDFTVAGFSVHAEQVVVTVESPDWRIRLTRRSIRSPLREVTWRLDTSMEMLVPEKNIVVWPHGILGQSWDGSHMAVDGKQDDYLSAGAEFTTSANLEGAIEGVIEDYEVASPFGTDFKHSRFGVHTATPPRDVSKLSGSKYKTNVTAVAGTTEEAEA